MESVDIESKMRELDDVMIRMRHLKYTQSLLKKFGLTGTQSYILWHLNRCGQTKASDLAKFAGLSPGAVTQVCDELVRTGLVERARSSDDRRVVNIDIAEPGRELLNQIQLERRKKMMQILEQLGPAESDTLIRLVTRVVDILEQDSNESQS